MAVLIRPIEDVRDTLESDEIIQPILSLQQVMLYKIVNIPKKLLIRKKMLNQMTTPVQIIKIFRMNFYHNIHIVQHGYQIEVLRLISQALSFCDHVFICCWFGQLRHNRPKSEFLLNLAFRPLLCSDEIYHLKYIYTGVYT